jgi:hypothetical protein
LMRMLSARRTPRRRVMLVDSDWLKRHPSLPPSMASRAYDSVAAASGSVRSTQYLLTQRHDRRAQKRRNFATTAREIR